MSDNVKIDIDGLKTIAASLKTEKEKILDIYQNDVVYILEKSFKCISKQGINYEEYNASMSNLFDLLYEYLSELTDLLSNKIIPRYENLSGDLVALFNNDFASKLSSLLDTE